MLDYPKGLITYCTHCKKNTLQHLNEDKNYICIVCGSYSIKEIIEKDLYIKEIEKMHKNLQNYLRLTHTDIQICLIEIDVTINQYETENF